MPENRYISYSEHLKEKYGEKVYKLPVNLPVTCPNKKNGAGGCIFCSDLGTGFEAESSALSVTEQMARNKENISKKYHAGKFIAYFQNYTNTFLPFEQFQQYIEEAAAFEDVVCISISTRPDCITREQLEFLKKIKEEKKLDITMELGLQTVNYHTLDKIQRGHGLGAFLQSVLMIHQYGFEICVHMILNLPYDTMRDCKEACEVLSALPITSVKLHSLYIAKNTKLSFLYKDGKISLCSKEEYLDRLVYFIEHIRPDMVIERLFSRIPEEESLFCNWGCSWRKLQEEFMERMRERDSYEGKYYIPLNETGFR